MILCEIFSTEGFPARWQCGDGWTPFWGWTHILSDVAIWFAYMAIPITMWVFARKRKDLRFPRVFWLYVAFIVLCGFTHLVEAGIFYWPVYRFLGVLKFATAIVSLATVVALIQIMPAALSVPGMAKVNAELQEENERRTRSEKRYRALVAATTSVVWRTSPEGTLVGKQDSWEKYTGQSFEEYQGEGWAAAMHEEDVPMIKKLWYAAVESGANYEGQCRLWSQQDGRYRWVQARGTPVHNDKGEITEWIGAMIDIDEKRRLSQELIEMNQALEKKNEQSQKFVYTVSHDLKSPVVTIRGFTDFMRNDLAVSKYDRLNHFIDRIDEASDIMSRSLADLLELSRVGFVSSNPEPVSIDSLVHEAIELHEPELAQRDAEIHVQPGLPTVLMDIKQVRQLYQNLINNALKYAEDASGRTRIYIEHEQTPHHLILSVRDEGPGIPAEHQDRVFEVFERLQNKTKGTGVGLSIVRQIADNYGGTATLQSPPSGHERGCRFVVRLPLSLLVRA